MKLGILTISDSVPPGKKQDLSGPKIDEIMAPLFAEISCRICTDDVAAITDSVLALLPAVDLLITNGGTGMMHRDNTGEALAAVAKPFAIEHLLLGQCPYSQRRFNHTMEESAVEACNHILLTI